MNRINPFKGMGVALVTPFCEDGSLDKTALENLLKYHLTEGTDFLCILGTTAETPCLSSEEQQCICNIVAKTVNKKIPLLLGCGGNNTSEVINRIPSFDFNVFDGILVVTPYYNKPSQEGLYRHYKKIAEASPVPVVLYNVPSRTGVNLEADTTLRIANECENVVAIKEASGNLEQIKKIISKAPNGFEVISGDDSLTLEIMKLGGVGVISVLGNVYPKDFKSMINHYLNGMIHQADEINNRLERMYKLLSAEGNPTGVKGFLAEKNMITNILRLPLVRTSESLQKNIYNFIKDFS